MTIKTVRPLNPTITTKLQSHEGFMYAHLVKFEKPIKTVTGAVAETARDYSYLTDASHNISFDDGTEDSLGNSNGTQVYVAERLLKVGQVAETTQAKATSMSLTIDSVGLNTILSPSLTTIDISELEITIGESWIDAGFTEGDKLRISSNDGNNGKFIIINKFKDDNKKISIIAEAGAASATNNTSYTFTIETEEHTSPFMDKDESSYAHYINREVFIYKALLDPTTGQVLGPITPPGSGTYIPGPFLIFKGIIAGVKVKEDPNKQSEVIWNLTSHWGDFVTINGRVTSDTEHRGINGQGESDFAALIRPEYVNDFGFMHSEQAINLIAKYQATETRYKFKKSGFLGLGSGKTIEYEVQVERSIELKFNLDARRLPVVYGVNRIDSFPIFVDLGRTDTSDVYAAYALCEGEIAGLYDIYLDDQSRICADENDNDARATGGEAVSVVCEGRKDRGDTLKGRNYHATSSYGFAYGGPYSTMNLTGVDQTGGHRSQQIYLPDTGWTEADTYEDSDLDPTSGIRHEKAHNFTSPINGRIIFHRGKPDQESDNLLTKKASESNSGGGFMLQHQYFDDTDKSNYWGPNHRLLDTAYVVANFDITEDDLEIPEMDFVVRGRILPCYDYDFSYRKDLKQTSAAATTFQLGESVTVKKTSDDSTISTVVLADFYTYVDEDNNEIQKWRFASDPGLGTTTAFYIQSGSNKFYMTTYDHALISGSINKDLRVGVASFAENTSEGVDITLAAESGHGVFMSKVIEYVAKVSPVFVDGTAEEAAAKIHFAGFDVDSVNTTTGVLQGVSTFTDGWTTDAIASVRVPKAIVLVGSGINTSTEDYYKDYFVTLTRIKADGTKVVQRRKIEKNKTIDGSVVAVVDQDWDIDASSDFSLEPKTFTGVSGRTADTMKIQVQQDTRVSINPAIQLLDYITNKRYGKGLSLEKDIDLSSFKTVARLCDTRSDITVILPNSASVVKGVSYKYVYNNNTEWQGTVKDTPTTVAFSGTNYKQVIFTDCIGKLAHRWFDWKVYTTGQILYDHKIGRAWLNTASNGTVNKATSGFLNNTGITLTRIGSGGDASINPWLGTFTGDGAAAAGSVSFEGHPLIKQSGPTGFTVNGYSLYDCDDVKYWRYLGWQSQNQREVTRHQACPIIDTKTTVFENINSLLAHFNGILRYSNGKYELDVQSAALLDGYTGSDPRIIREDDIVGAITVEDSGQKQSKNTVTVNFPDPQQEYGQRSVTYFDSNYLAEDRNIPKKEDIKTPHIINYFNARINAKQYLDQSRYAKKINFVMEPKGNLLLAGTIIQVSYPRFGWGSDDLLVQQYSTSTTTTLAPHGFKVGDVVRYKNVTSTTDNIDSELNDNYFTVATVPSTTTFTTDQPTPNSTVTTGCGVVYKKGTYFRISNLNFREDCSVQVTAIEHNDKSYLISKRKSDIAAVDPHVKGPDAPGPPSNTAAAALDDNKGINVTWTNNASGYKTVAGVTSWKDDTWKTEIWMHTAASYSSGSGAKLTRTIFNGVEEEQIFPTGSGAQTRYFWVRHMKKVRPVGGKQGDYIWMPSTYYPASSDAGVSATAQGTVAIRSIQVEPTNGVQVSYTHQTKRLTPTGNIDNIGSGGYAGNLQFKVTLKNFDTTKRWFYRYWTNVDDKYLLSTNGTGDATQGSSQHGGISYWNGSANSQSYDTFILHTNYEPKSTGDKGSGVGSYAVNTDSVILHVEAFELEPNQTAISNSSHGDPTAVEVVALSSINLTNPTYTVDFNNFDYLFLARSNGTADVSGFATTPVITRDDPEGKVTLTYEKYSSSAGDNTFSYGDDSNETFPNSSNTQPDNSEDGVVGTNCNPKVNTSTGAVSLDAEDSGGIASGTTTPVFASISIQIKDNKALKNGVTFPDSTIDTQTISLKKIPNPVREGTTLIVDISENSDDIDADLYADFAASGNLSGIHAQHAAAYVISETSDGFIRPNDILTITNGTSAKHASRIYIGNGTSDASSVGAGNWSATVTEVFDGSVIVNNTLSAQTLAANTTFTRSLKVGSDLTVGSTDADGNNMAGQINSPTKTQWNGSGDGFYFDHAGQVWIGNNTNYLKYDGNGNWTLAGTLNLAGPAGNTGQSTAIVFQRAASKPTQPSNAATVTASISGTNWTEGVPVGSNQLWASTGTKPQHAPGAASSTNFTWQAAVEYEGADSTVPGPTGPGGASGPGLFSIVAASTASSNITSAKIKGAIGRENAGGYGYSVKGDVCIVKVMSGNDVTGVQAYTCGASSGTPSATNDSYVNADALWSTATQMINGALVVDGSITTNNLAIQKTGNSGILMTAGGTNQEESKIEVFGPNTEGNATVTRVKIGYLGT